MLAKEGYKPAIHGTTVIKTYMDENGYIVTEGSSQTVAGQKAIRITRTNADNSAAENFQVINTLLGFMEATALSQTNTFDVKWEVPN